MSNSSYRWQDVIRSRFGEREDLGADELYEQYWAVTGLPKAKVLECLELIETEYQLAAGILRPEDSLDLLFDAVSTRNPLKWFLSQPAIEDRASEINHQLAKRMEESGTLGTWRSIETVDDLIRAWCGQKQPSQLRVMEDEP